MNHDQDKKELESSPEGSLSILAPNPQRPANRSAQHEWPFAFPLWCYLTIGLMGLALFTWLFAVYTMRTVHQLAYWTTDGWFVGWGWGGLTTLALAWAVVNVSWSRKSLLELKIIESYSHWAVALCCGLATLGLHYISAARSMTEGPLIVDPNGWLPAESTEETLSGPVYGKANRGKAWFALTCVTCHGPTGDGINNLAPSLKGSEFLKTADPVAINLLIRRGRAITDPLNKSGKPMPVRGGDPTITDEKVADLVAFVMSLHSRTADADAVSWEGVESAPPSLSRKSFLIRPQHPTVRQTNLTALTVHGIFLGCVMLSSCYLLFGWMRGWPTKRCRPWIYVNTWGWIIALLGWLVVLFILSMFDSKLIELIT